MTEHDARSYYLLMLNALAGMEDDLRANGAPDAAIRHVMEAYRLCREDFALRFSGAGSDQSDPV